VEGSSLAGRVPTQLYAKNCAKNGWPVGSLPKKDVLLFNYFELFKAVTFFVFNRLTGAGGHPVIRTWKWCFQVWVMPSPARKYFFR
jgi:hypothetical protein